MIDPQPNENIKSQLLQLHKIVLEKLSFTPIIYKKPRGDSQPSQRLQQTVHTGVIQVLFSYQVH